MATMKQAASAAKRLVGAAIRAPKKILNAWQESDKKYQRIQAQKEVADIERAFGSVSAYKKLNPMFRTRGEQMDEWDKKAAAKKAARAIK